MAKGTVFVASPSATASTPEAIGSSVPAWPAFCASKTRFTMPTTCVEVTPIGLSMIIQPCTGSPLRLRAIAVFTILSGFQVALNTRGFEQRLDFLRLGERIVFREPKFGCEAQTNPVPKTAAPKDTVTVE